MRGLPKLNLAGIKPREWRRQDWPSSISSTSSVAVHDVTLHIVSEYLPRREGGRTVYGVVP